MTTELFCNVVQLCVCLLTAVWMTILAVRYERMVHILMAGFTDTFALGTLYWVTHQLLKNHTPETFYLSEISWMAAPLFLLSMEIHSAKEVKQGRWHPYVLGVYLVALGLWAFFTWEGGDGLANAMYMSATAICFAKAIQNYLYGDPSGRSIHLFCMLFATVEWLLWLAECIWHGNTWTNPYFWVDTLLTVTIALTVPAVKGAWRYDLS